MKLVLFACAENVIIDAKTNNLSLINVIEDRISEGFPLLIPQVNIVSVVRREDGDEDEVVGRLKVKIGDETIADTPVSFDLKGTSLSRSIGQLQQLVIPHPVSIRFTLTVGNRKIGTWESRILGNPRVDLLPTPKAGLSKRAAAQRVLVASTPATEPKAKATKRLPSK